MYVCVYVCVCACVCVCLCMYVLGVERRFEPSVPFEGSVTFEAVASYSNLRCCVTLLHVTLLLYMHCLYGFSKFPVLASFVVNNNLAYLRS